ncbi:MAG: 50S ribosomal protein L5 [Planctomycetes bacterium]|nr:50S ribosomal protein L5 [Planctomycetota bacterium]
MLQKDVYQRYQDAIGSLKSDLSVDNIHAVPRIEKVVVSMGLGKCLGDKKKIDEALGQLTQITGQKAVITKARKSVSGFRLREGVDVGCCVTLRRERMYSFLTRLVCIVLPRVRDFRGLRRTSFDGHGNYSFGITEQGVFPEVDPEKVTFPQGMNVCVVTTAKNNNHGLRLLTAVGFPFQRDD